MLNAKSGDGGTTEIAARPTLVKIDQRAPAPLSQLLKNGLLAVTPELAHRLILECGYDRQRSVRPLHVSALAKQMSRKEWTPGTQIHFVRMTADGWFRLVDGQHRLHAVVEANTTVEFQILVSECKTEAEAARLYRRHDRLIAPRSVSDMLIAEGIPSRFALNSRIATGVFSASLIIAHSFVFGARYLKADPYLQRSDEARLRLCEPWWPIAQHYGEAIHLAERQVKGALTKSGPFAVALVTLRHQEAKADAFWRGLANNDGLKRNDPRAAYRRFLNVGQGGVNNAFQMAKAASIAWNAFFSDRQLDYIRLTESPIRIDGCELE